MGYPGPRRPCKSGQFTTERGRKRPQAFAIQTLRNPTTSSPLLCCPGSQRNAFSVTNSRCFPIVTLPSLSAGMCVCVCAWGSRIGCWGLELPIGELCRRRKKKARKTGSRLSGIAVNINTTLLHYHLPPLLLPTAPRPMTELWRPGGGGGGGGLQAGPPASVTLAPSPCRNKNTWMSGPLVLAVSWPLSTAFNPFN